MPKSEQPQEGTAAMLDRIFSFDVPRPAILDVGVGGGKWGNLLWGRLGKGRVDGLEVFKPLVTPEILALYHRFYVMDVREVESFVPWHIVILGDVLEHLPHGAAVGLVTKLMIEVPLVLLSIPIKGPREQDGKKLGNPYETHRYHWSAEELLGLGFRELHRGPNPNGLVTIGTYELRK